MCDNSSQMDLKKVQELVELMVENDLVEVEVSEGESKIHLKRPGHTAPAMVAAPAAPYPMAAAPAAAAPAAEVAEDSNLIDINSPMVGTFYAAASPDTPDYVKPGDSVNADTVVCIVEAMKVMNEIKAEVSGIIEKVMVANGEAVEFGQSIYKVKPL